MVDRLSTHSRQGKFDPDLTASDPLVFIFSLLLSNSSFKMLNDLKRLRFRVVFVSLGGKTA